MTQKDYLTLIISGLAITISILTFLLTYKQRAMENARAVRKALTDTIAGLVSVALERAKLDSANPSSMEENVVQLRRIYNHQRRYLADHAELLASQFPNLPSDVDFNALAVAWDAIGDADKAKQNWEKCIAKSPSAPLRAMNLRGYAGFLYFQGQSQAGRAKYEESLAVELPDTDNMRRIKSDTYLMWAKTEHDFGSEDEGKRIREQATSAAKRIGNARMRAQALQYITASWTTIPVDGKQQQDGA